MKTKYDYAFSNEQLVCEFPYRDFMVKLAMVGGLYYAISNCGENLTADIPLFPNAMAAVYTIKHRLDIKMPKDPMTIGQYEIAKHHIYQASEQALKDLALQYAKENNPYIVGDVITDHVHTIIIESIGYWLALGEPQCAYTGVWLKKDGNPNKLGEKHTVYQSNIVKPETKS